MTEYLKKYAHEVKNADKTCFRCYYYLKSLETDKEWKDTVLSVCLNPEYKWFGDRDLTFSNWYGTEEKTMQGTLIETSKHSVRAGCDTPGWCTGRILEDKYGRIDAQGQSKSV